MAPTGRGGPARRRSARATVNGLLHDLRTSLDRLLRRGDHVIRRRPRPVRRPALPPPQRRPDGSLIPAPPAAVAGRDGRGPAGVMMPFRKAGDALANRWRDAMREARLAAREKETEVRAAYERRVQHDPHWHAQQRKRGQGH